MEDNKCCTDGACEKCKDKSGMCCGHKCCMRKCHMLKIIVPIVIIIIAICFGFVMGSHMGNFRGRGENQRFMNNRYGIPIGNYNTVTGSTTVKVIPDTTTPPTTPQ